MRQIIILVIALCLFIPVSAGAAPVWLSFYEQVQLAGTEIRLGDIADVQGDDAEQVAALKNIKIANAAAPGGKITFTERLFQLRFLAAAGQQPEVDWQFGNNIIVTTQAQQLTGEELVLKVKDYLKQAIVKTNEQRDYKIESVKVPADLTLPVGQITYEYKLPYGVRYAVPDNVTVLIYVNGQLLKKTVVRMQVHVYESVIVAARPINTKQLIASEDIRRENYDVSSLPANYFRDSGLVVGMVSKRIIKEGMPIIDSMLDKPVIMARASIIKIVSKVGNVQVDVEGQALQPGKLGQWIRVKNTKTGKVVMGKVADAVTVEVTAS